MPSENITHLEQALEKYLTSKYGKPKKHTYQTDFSFRGWSVR
jgi:hypothetical protein